MSNRYFLGVQWTDCGQRSRWTVETDIHLGKLPLLRAVSSDK